MNSQNFESWWQSYKQVRNQTDKNKMEALSGWTDAENNDGVSLMRGIGPYCEGWNACMHTKSA